MTGDILGARILREAAATARAQSREQYRMVTAYPDLRDRLCQPPIGYKRPEQWTGYIPPAQLAAGETGYVRLNDSPRRAALMKLVEEAAERWDRDTRQQRTALPAGREHDEWNAA